MKQFAINIQYIITFLILGLMCFVVDASAQWTTQNSNTTETLNYIQFVTPDIGYVIGENGTFLKTTDAGDTWTSMGIPLSGEFGEISSLHFVNELEGMIEVDNKGIAKTIDGGNNWEMMDIGEDVGTITIRLIDDEIGILVNNNKIFRTTDFGDTWSEVSIGTLADEFSSSDEIEFLNDNIGWIVTNSVMLKTYDGGLTWELDYSYWTHPDLALNAALLHRIEAITEDILFVGSQYYIGFFSSIDGGDNFEYIPMIVKDIDFLNASVGYAIDDQGNAKLIKKTSDAGANWTIIHEFPSPSIFDNLYDLHFIDENIGFAVGSNGTIMKTVNGGGTTTSIDDPEIENDAIHVFPNPASHQINYELRGDLNIEKIRLYDNAGKEILVEFNQHSQDIIIEDLNLPYQIYNLIFLLDNGKAISKRIELTN